MVHLKNTTYSPQDAAPLLSMARELVPEQVVVRDTRVSGKYLEFDLSIPDTESLESVVGNLENISPLADYEHLVEHHMEDGAAIAKAIKLFNDEKYWGAHEALEHVWKRASGKEKELVQGIILVAAAFVHAQKDEQDVCISILQRADSKLEGAADNYHGIDVSGIRSRVKNILGTAKIESFKI